MATRRTKALLQIWDTSAEEQAGEGAGHQWKTVYTDRTNNKNALIQFQLMDRLGQPQVCKLEIINPPITSTQAMLLNEVLDDSETNILVDTVTGGGYPSSQAPTNSYVKVDDELMKVTGYSSTSLTVQRAALNTTAVEHDNNTPVFRDPRGASRGYVENTYDKDLIQLGRIRVLDSVTQAILFVGRIYTISVKQDISYGSVINLVAFDSLRELADNRLSGTNANFKSGNTKVTDIIENVLKYFSYNTVDDVTFTKANISTADTLKFNASASSTAGNPDYSSGNHTGLSAISREALADPHSASTSDTAPDSAFGYTYYVDSGFTTALKTANPTTYPPALNYFKRESFPEVAANTFFSITAKGDNQRGNSGNSYTTTAVTMSDFDMSRVYSDVITDLSVRVPTSSGDPETLNCVAFNISDHDGAGSGSVSYSTLFNNKTIEESPKVFIDTAGSAISVKEVGSLIYLSTESGGGDGVAVIALSGDATSNPASLLYGRDGTYNFKEILFAPYETGGVQTTTAVVNAAGGAAYDRVRANATTSSTYGIRRMSVAAYDSVKASGHGGLRRAIGSHFIARDGTTMPRRGSLHLAEFPMATMRFDPTAVGNTQITVPTGAGHPDTRGIRKGAVVRQLDADGVETGKFGYVSGVADGSYDIDVTLYNVSTENAGGTHVAQATTNWAGTDQADVYVPIRAGHVVYVTNPYLHIGGDALITQVTYDEGMGVQTTTLKYVMDNPAALVEPVTPAPMVTTLDVMGQGVTNRAQSARVVPNSGTTVFSKGSYQQVNWPIQKIYIGSKRYDIAAGDSTTANGGSAISNSEWSAVYFKPADKGGSDIAYDVDTVENIRANSSGTAVIVAKIRASTSASGDPEWEPQISMPQGAQYDLTGSDVFGGSFSSSLFSDGNKSFTSDLAWTGVSDTEVGWSNGSSGNGTVTLSDGTALTITKSTNGSGVGYGLTTNTYYFYVAGLDGAGTYSMAKSLTASDASGDNKILLATVGVDTSLGVKPVILPYFSKQPSISAVSIQADGIIADNVDALAITSKHTITGATIQTSASSNTGVKLTGAGINIYEGTASFFNSSGYARGQFRAQDFTWADTTVRPGVAVYGPSTSSLSSPTIANLALFGHQVGNSSQTFDAVTGQTANTSMLVYGSAELKGTSGNYSRLFFTASDGAPQGALYVAGGVPTAMPANLETKQRMLVMDNDISLADYWAFDVGVDGGGVYRKFMYPSNAVAGGTVDGTVGESWNYIGSYDNSGTWTSAALTGVQSYYFNAGDGALGAPGFNFSGDTNTGFYRISSGNIGVSGDGTQRGQFGFHSQTIAPSSGSTTAYVSFSVLGNYGLWGASGPSYFNHIRPAIDDFYDVGSSTLRFDDVYATSGTVNTSDARAKEKISPSTLGLSFINDLNPVSYKWKKKKEHKIDQTHYGIVAQEVMETLKKYGVDSVEDFGGITHDGGEEDQYGARYAEFVPILIKAVQELSAEVKQLKEKN